MKKILIALTLTAPMAAMACGELSDYKVNDLSFAKTPIKRAIPLLLADTPFKAMFQGESDKRIAAKGISGSLEEVLRSMAEQSGLTFSRDDCVITFAPEIDGSLRIRQGDIIDERLSEWAARLGYTLIWQAGRYRAEAPLVLDLGLEQSLEILKEAMKINKVNLAISIYENQVIRVSEGQ